MPTGKELGKQGENLVAEKYKSEGFKLLERNYISPRGKQMGEIDLIFRGDRIKFYNVDKKHEAAPTE